MSDGIGDRPGSAGGRQRTVISTASKPRLARGRRLHYDEARGRWVVQAPERLFVPDAIAVTVLQLCDGSRTVADLAETLSTRYDAPKERILEDIADMLQSLADGGVVSCSAEPLH